MVSDRPRSPLAYYPAARHHANWQIARVDPLYMWIIDLDGAKSITNDAEWVTEQLNRTHPGRRIFYRDTMNNWDELEHLDGKFIGFKPAREFAI